MTARFSWNQGNTRGHRPRLQQMSLRFLPLLKFHQNFQGIVAVDPTELGCTETGRLHTSSRRGNVTERKIRPEDNLSSRNKELQRLQLNRIRRARRVIKEPPDVIQTRVRIRDFSQAVCRYLIA